MLKKLRSEKGEYIIVALAIFALVGATGSFLAGNLKPSGQRIWCKVQGINADWCDAQYPR